MGESDGRVYVGAFPAHVRAVVGEATLRLVIRPLDDGVGERWEVSLDAEGLGASLLGVEVVRPVDVYKAPGA